MPCLSLGITPPTFDIPGLSIGFGLPPISLNADLCCKINVGPFPDISLAIPLPLPTSVMVALNTAMLAFGLYIDQILSNAAIDCPLD